MANENPFEDPFADSKEGSEKNDAQHFTQKQPISNGGGFQQGTYQIPLPNSTGALVLGICAIVGAFCYAIPGIVCGIIGLILANGGEKLYKADPSKYTTQSYNNNKAGKITSIIGLALGGVVIVILIIYLIIMAAAFNSMSYMY